MLAIFIYHNFVLIWASYYITQYIYFSYITFFVSILYAHHTSIWCAIIFNAQMIYFIEDLLCIIFENIPKNKMDQQSKIAFASPSEIHYFLMFLLLPQS